MNSRGMLPRYCGAPLQGLGLSQGQALPQATQVSVGPTLHPWSVAVWQQSLGSADRLWQF